MKHVIFEFECSGLCHECPDLDCPYRDIPYGSKPSLIEKEKN